MKDFPIIFSADMVLANHAGRKRMTRRVVRLDRLKVRIRDTVLADFPLNLINPKTKAKKGEVLRATINPFGAVSCITPGGELGLKPGEFDFICPYAQGETVLGWPGDGSTWSIVPHESAVWVRENIWQEREGCTYPSGEYVCNWRWKGSVAYMADYPDRDWDDKTRPWHKMATRPSIHMPRWACRDVYTVISVRLEKLHLITEEDAVCEGVELVDREPNSGEPVYRDYFQGDYAWSARASFVSLWHKLHGFGKPESWDSNPWVWVIEYLNPEWWQHENHS